MKKLLRKSIIWIVLLLYMVLIYGFVDKRYENQLCSSIEVTVSDSLRTGFVNRKDILDLIEDHGINCLGEPVYTIDLDSIEKAIRSNQIIDECRAYMSLDGTLRVEVWQREPFVRIMEENGKEYYLDREGNVLNISPHFTPHVLVVNGHLRTSFEVGSPFNVSALNDEDPDRKMREIFELASYIDADELWRSQILQLYVNAAGEYEMVPRVGPHLIILGPVDNFAEKFENLEIFYKQGLNRVGWNKYLKINLKYKDQIVCTKI